MTPSAAPDLPFDLARALDEASSRLGLFSGRVRHLPEVASTNDVLTELARLGAPEGTVVTADRQVAGRGRLGRQWFSPAESGLYTSALLRPARWPVGAASTAHERSVGLVTMATGVALAEALRSLVGAPVELKWPNDLMIADRGPGRGGWRKLGGILAEATSDAGRVSTIVVGFGVNVRRTAYPAELADVAIALEDCGRVHGRWDVLTGMLAALAMRVHDLREGRVETVVETFRSLSPSCAGTALSWRVGPTVREGTTAGVDEEGALLVRTARGIERLIAGELVWHV
jgi:BirA family biotin operon repressor/biotin-[acetyl-CoA-carboxylase] ligase